MIHPVLCLGYLALAALLLRHESARRRQNGFDAFHVVLFFYGLYVLLASVAIHAMLAINPQLQTGVGFFDSVYQKLDTTQALAVFLLNIVFLAGFYLVRQRFGGALPTATAAPPASIEVDMKPRAVAIWLIAGIAFCGLFFWGLGDNFVERYANLILFRNLDETAERNAFSANAFSATMTFSWFSAALTFYFQRRQQWLKFWLLLALTIFFSLLMGSRRGFVFPLLIIYLCFVMARNRTFLARLLYFAPIAVLWISFGKELTGSIAYDGNAADLLDTYTSLDAGLLRAFSDIGIGQVQSFAVLQHFDFDPRYGSDHLLSVLRRIPGKEFLGIADYFPERITRITTALFASPDDADIPPGLIGASWLDFPLLGAFAWGSLLALQAGFIEYCRARVVPGAAVTLLTVLAATIVAMPINSGTFDFTFSIDIVLVVFVLATSTRVRRPVQNPAQGSAPAVPDSK